MNKNENLKTTLFATGIALFITFVLIPFLFAVISLSRHYEYVDEDGNKGTSLICSNNHGNLVCSKNDGTIIKVKEYKERWN